jgi:hypothetical protein
MKSQIYNIISKLLILGCQLLLLLNTAFAQGRLPVFSLKGEYLIENDKKYDNTVIGGLSGIDYSSGNTFYIVSDDPGEHGAPRFYKVIIDYSEKQGIKNVNFLTVNYLKAPMGKTFEASANNADTTKFIYSDAESIRYDDASGRFLWSSEGYNSKGIMFQPFIFNMDTNGVFIHRLRTDSIFKFDSSGKKGVQHNATFEALDVIPGSSNIVYCSEKSVLQDIRSFKDEIKPIRITIANKISGATLSQFAYPIEDVYKNNSNGVVELLAISADTLWVLERAFDIMNGCSIRLYQATAHKTTDVKQLPELKDKQFTFMKKELLLDFSKTGIKHIDNIEGMTWGYSLSGNKKTILFISDNNFNAFQISQLLLFEYENK